METEQIVTELDTIATRRDTVVEMVDISEKEGLGASWSDYAIFRINNDAPVNKAVALANDLQGKGYFTDFREEDGTLEVKAKVSVDVNDRFTDDE